MTPPTSTSTTNKWIVLSVVSLGTLMSTLDGGIMSVSYPALAEAFHTEPSVILWVSVAFWVTSVGLLLTLGWLGDVAGRRRVFSLGFAVFALSTLASVVAADVWQLIATRIVQGVGSSMVLSNLNALIAGAFPENERGRAMGVSGAVVGVGLSLGPLLGGFVLDVLDWRALFYTRVPLAVLGAVMGWWLLPRDRVHGGNFKVDWLGAGSLFATLGCFLLVVNQGGRLGFGSPVVIALAVAGAASAPVLVWSQRRSARPIVEVALLRSSRYAVSVLVLITHYLAHGGILLAAPFYLIGALGFSSTKMGLFIAGFYAGRAFVAPPVGWLSDVLGPRSFLVVGNLFLAAALLWLSGLGTGPQDWALLAAMLLGGVGSAFFEPVVTSVIMGSVPSDRLGTASASIAMGRHFAFAVGVALAGAIFTIRERAYLAASGGPGEAASAPATAGAFGDTLLAGVALAVVAAALSLGVGDRLRRRERAAIGDAVP